MVSMVTHSKQVQIFIKVSLVFYFFILSYPAMLISQNFSQVDKKEESTFSLMGLGSGYFTKMPEQSGNMLMFSVNEDEYKIDAGDIFIIKVDVKGPAFKLFNSVVTPDGYLIIPDAPTVYVRYLTLKKAKNEIDNVLRKSFPQATVESHLLQVHQIKVNLLGAIPLTSTLILNSSNRLYAAVTQMIEPMILDKTIIFNWDIVSFRTVDLKRKTGTKRFDLLRYKLLGDRSQNPYLQDEDIIYINFRDSTRYTVSVKGAIARPVEFEFRNGDDLKTAIRFASGLLPTADSTRVELARFDSDKKSLLTEILSFPADSNYGLQPDDRIYIREKKQYHEKYSVFLEGEVNYPGEYPIDNGKTYLSELIERAGGFTDDAAILSSSIIRKTATLSDESELKRLENIRPLEMTVEEASYFRLRTRENRYIVTVDNNKLFLENDKTTDILLYDQDLVVIPERKLTVFVSGGVIRPGNITYRSDWSYEDYIMAAGGYTDMARESWVTIIDSRTGKWNDVSDNDQVSEGDIIFIPERDRIDFYRWFIDGLSIVAQVSAIVLVVVSLAK
jgi:protein involved in polysaccharide export with SLBB domain